jgi:hypothetical protein
MALSTIAGDQSSSPKTPVIYPVTPNGVEHFVLVGRGHGVEQVIYPVTPNGVEHSCPDHTRAKHWIVIYPVTPNGVEHTTGAE